ncbi:MAG TPA: hypothetical protein VKP11_00530 [Frankiaceae bacterium]|nr:hypothetical protein [Frankiaceae bacterium]
MDSDDAERLRRLEEKVDVLGEAVRTLARGLERPPTDDEPGELAASRAARLAHEILLAAGL